MTWLDQQLEFIKNERIENERRSQELARSQYQYFMFLKMEKRKQDELYALRYYQKLKTENRSLYDELLQEEMDGIYYEGCDPFRKMILKTVNS